MIVIFSSMTIDPAKRSELDGEMAMWLSMTERERAAASIYRYMSDPSDPSKVYFFQSWPDEESFATWTQQPAFSTLLDKYRNNGAVADVGAVIFEGCTGTRGGPL